MIMDKLSDKWIELKVLFNSLSLFQKISSILMLLLIIPITIVLTPIMVIKNIVKSLIKKIW